MGNTSTAKLTLEEKKARRRERAKKYHAANRERICERRKKRYEANKENEKKQQKKYWESNKEKIAEHVRKYRKNHPGIYREYQEKYHKKYYEVNKERLLTKAVKRHKERLLTDKVYYLKDQIRRRLYQAVRNKYKTGSAIRDMGCTGQEACEHIESMFDEKMTWGNHGNYWHIDHIFPLSAANLENRSEFLAVNNWRNLQPLEAKANLAKGDKVTPAARRLFNKLVKEFS